MPDELVDYERNEGLYLDLKKLTKWRKGFIIFFLCSSPALGSYAATMIFKNLDNR